MSFMQTIRTIGKYAMPVIALAYVVAPVAGCNFDVKTPDINLPTTDDIEDIINTIDDDTTSDDDTIIDDDDNNNTYNACDENYSPTLEYLSTPYVNGERVDYLNNIKVGDIVDLVFRLKDDNCDLGNITFFTRIKGDYSQINPLIQYEGCNEFGIGSELVTQRIIITPEMTGDYCSDIIAIDECKEWSEAYNICFHIDVDK